MAHSLLLIIRPGGIFGTCMRPRVTDMDSEASVPILSESQSDQASDLLPGSKGSKPAILSLLDRLRAPQRSELTWKRAVKTNLSAADSHHKKRPCCLPTQSRSLREAECLSTLMKTWRFRILIQ